MSRLIWWFGVAHAAVYSLAGMLVLITLLTVKLHQYAKVMGRIIQWHYARQKWLNGNRDEEPKP